MNAYCNNEAEGMRNLNNYSGLSRNDRTDLFRTEIDSLRKTITTKIEKKAVLKNLDLKKLKIEKTRNLSMEKHMDIQETAKKNFYNQIIWISDLYNNTYDKIIYIHTVIGCNNSYDRYLTPSVIIVRPNRLDLSYYSWECRSKVGGPNYFEIFPRQDAGIITCGLTSSADTRSWCKLI